MQNQAVFIALPNQYLYTMTRNLFMLFFTWAIVAEAHAQQYILTSFTGNYRYDDQSGTFEEIFPYRSIVTYQIKKLDGTTLFSCSDCKPELKKTGLYFSYRSNNKWGLIDPLRKIKTAAEGSAWLNDVYDSSLVIRNDQTDSTFIYVSDGSHISFGKTAIAPWDIKQKRVRIIENGKFGLCDFKGEVILPCMYTNIETYKTFAKTYTSADKFDLFDLTTREPLLKNISKGTFSDHAFLYSDGASVMLLDISDKVQQKLFDDAGYFNIAFAGKGRYIVHHKDGYMLLDSTGKNIKGTVFSFLEYNAKTGRYFSYDKDEKTISVFNNDLTLRKKTSFDILISHAINYTDPELGWDTYTVFRSGNKYRVIGSNYELSTILFDKVDTDYPDFFEGMLQGKQMYFDFNLVSLKPTDLRILKTKYPNVYKNFVSVYCKEEGQKKCKYGLMDDRYRTLIPAVFDEIIFINSSFYCFDYEKHFVAQYDNKFRKKKVISFDSKASFDPVKERIIFKYNNNDRELR